MMYMSPALLIILYGHIGFSDASARISRDDASPSSSRKPGSDTWGSLPADTPRIVPEGSGSLLGPVTAAPTLQPPSTDARVTEPSTAPGSRPKRSAEAPVLAPVLAPEKMLQTMMVSTGSRRTDNDAWAADGPTGPSSVEQQESLCNCSSGSEGILDPDECDRTSGQCSCLSGYTGLQCDDCEKEYFTNGTSGCLPCSCDSFGAVHPECDSSGNCVCKMGVYGPKCDECHPGYFHFSSTGCRPCQCNNHTNYCHPQSGVCLNCEGNTQGSNCDECKPSFFRSPGSDLTTACAPCPCSNSTSTSTCRTDSSGSPVCDQCLPHYSGLLCDKCSAGFYNASGACVPCDCSGNADPHGPAQLCHPDTGHCFSCIHNTSGPQCQLCAPGFIGNARAHNCTRLAPRLMSAPADPTTPGVPTPTSTYTSTTMTSTTSRGTPASRSSTNTSTVPSSTQALLTSLSSPTDNTTAALTEVSWTQFNIIILAVIILVVLLLLSFVGGVYTYREYQNRKLNAPFWTIELKEDNISFSSYHDSIPNADVSGLLEDEANEVAPNGQLALTTQGNCYKA